MAEEEVKKIECEVCKKHVPESAAITFEGTDMVHYFCCTDCMNYWKKEHPELVGNKK